MIKVRYLLCLVVFVISVFAAGDAVSQEKAVEKAGQTATTKAIVADAKASAAATAVDAKAVPEEKAPDMTNKEILKRLKDMLQNRADIAVDGLQVTKDASGAVSYLYKGKNIDDLDKDTLMKLLRNVNQQASWKSYESLQRQLKAMKQLDDLNKMQRAASQTRTPAGAGRSPGTTQIPKSYTPPKTINTR